MVPVLLICLTACYGLWLGAYHLHNQVNSCKVDDTSKDNCDRLIDKIPIFSNVEDRISDLPDELLSEILSHLSLLDALKLTTLSRRWRFMWLTLPCLHLDWCEMSDLSNFSHLKNYKLYKEAFVEKLNQILQRFKNRNICSFHLIFWFDRSYASNVDKWIEFAAEKHLESLNLRLDNPFFRLNPNFDEFYIISDLQEIELNAKNLKTFEFVGKVAVKCSFVSTSNLENVYVCLTERVKNGAEYMFKNLANHISSLKVLVLRGEYPLIDNLPNHPPLFFQSVLRLDLCMRFDDPQVDILMVLPCLLKSFPLLQKLYLRMPRTDTSHPKTRRRNELPLVQFHTNLKEIEFGYFRCCWIEFAGYLLRSATVLDRMVISQHDKYYSGCGIWHTKADPVGKEERYRIYSALRGKAISPNVNVIIHYDGGFFLI